MNIRNLKTAAVALPLLIGNGAKATAQEVSTKGAKQVTTTVVEKAKTAVDTLNKERSIGMAEVSEKIQAAMDSVQDAKKPKMYVDLSAIGATRTPHDAGLRFGAGVEKGHDEGQIWALYNSKHHEAVYNFSARYNRIFDTKNPKVKAYAGGELQATTIRTHHNGSDQHAQLGNKLYGGVKYKTLLSPDWFLRVRGEAGPQMNARIVNQTNTKNNKVYFGPYFNVEAELGSPNSDAFYANKKHSHNQVSWILGGGYDNVQSNSVSKINGSSVKNDRTGIGWNIYSGARLRFIDQPEAQQFPHWNENFNSMIKK